MTPMKDIILRLSLVHASVLVLAAVVSGLVWGWSTSGVALVGALAFTIPVLAFSGLVWRASQGEQTKFLGRFMAAEALKWVSAAALLTLAFVSGLVPGFVLLAGFVLSVIAQLIFPIFAPKVRVS